MPRDCVQDRERKDRVPYTLWESRGWIKFTAGSTTDYGVIEADIIALATEFDLVELAYDPREASQLAIGLPSWGLPVYEFHQNIVNYNEPTKELEALLRAGRLTHGSHPVLDWMAGNAAVLRDRQGRMRPLKPGRKLPDGQWQADETKKVDGVQASVMALARAMLAPAAAVVAIDFW